MGQLEEELSDLESTLSALPETTTEPPRNIFDVLGIHSKENAWRRLFAYLLDPEEPHGFGIYVLKAFLDILENHDDLNFQFSQSDLTEIEVEEDVPTQNGNRPDIVVKSGKKWFILIELKVLSEEGDNQTKRYVKDNYVGEDRKEEFEEQYYLYISRSQDNSDASKFVDLDWITIANGLKDVISKYSRQIPSNSQMQLSDFINNIEEVLGMTKYREDINQKKELYFEHREAIETAREAVKNFVEKEMQNKWDTKLLQEENRPTYWDGDEWSLDKVGKEYGQIRFEDWKRAKGLDIHFEHFPKVDEFRKGKLRFELHVENDKNKRNKFREKIKEKFHVKEDDGDEFLVLKTQKGEKYKLGYNSGGRTITKKTYKYNPGDSDGYYQKLSQAFDEHYKLAKEIVGILDEI